MPYLSLIASGDPVPWGAMFPTLLCTALASPSSSFSIMQLCTNTRVGQTLHFCHRVLFSFLLMCPHTRPHQTTLGKLVAIGSAPLGVRNRTRQDNAVRMCIIRASATIQNTRVRLQCGCPRDARRHSETQWFHGRTRRRLREN
ncbi:hypothetical protein PAXRUDRAFT_751039 [Paxillus rubicundulus Ve08.2h10]|uniref:Uncharacterized protein n=1 Tax=Paxillus rubicundulus Ve08.2h10 TaxID=930991 RepID=A0A0D0E1V4_9AGAM|nr:hypothetical protein PAXRUDRAFT_751039 [Paxillus rubicundulus Ve08.2h10]